MLALPPRNQRPAQSRNYQIHRAIWRAIKLKGSTVAWLRIFRRVAVSARRV
nr:MAG TPA: hypothetical protein [Caudoviricetes sp.]